MPVHPMPQTVDGLDWHVTHKERMVKQLLPSEKDLKTWDLIVDRYPGAFGSGSDDPDSIGLSGDLWVMLPVEASDVRLMWDATGMHKDHAESGYKLIEKYDDLKVQFKLLKFKSGMFSKAFWIMNNEIMFGRDRVANVGFFCVRSLLDVPKVIDGFSVGDLSPKATAAEASASFTIG